MSYKITDKCNGCRLCVKICPVTAITGEKKEVHSINEDICIDCGACGRICKPEAVLDDRQQSCRYIKKTQWQKPKFLLDNCTACTACVNVCPVDVITLEIQKKKNIHAFPLLSQPKNCIACSFCFDICASGAIEMAIPEAAKN